MKINKQYLKTRAKATIIASTLAILSSVASAENYTVSVEMNSSIGETPLVANQTQPMSYPVLEVNEATQEGAECVVDDKPNATGYNNQPATSANSLCPGATGVMSRVTLSGVPNAVIVIDYKLPVQEQNGVRFGWRGQAYSNISTSVLSGNDGTTEAVLGSSITLFDKSQVTDSVMVFNYEISAAYQ